MNCNVNKKKILANFLFLLLIFAVPLFAKEITLGGKTGWPELDVEQNITTGSGRFGYKSLTIDTNSFKPDEYTDLILNFEKESSPILTGDYKILQNELQVVSTTDFGKGCGLSRNTGGITIQGGDYTFFGNEGLRGSFCIEFWLNPAIVENGESIIKWHSSRNIDKRIIYQVITAAFKGGRLEWTLSNIFDSFFPQNRELTLTSSKTVIPNKWSYHVLSFDIETGLLQYLVDGLLEDVKFITTTGHEGGDVSLVYLGASASLELCSEYTGKIDDFKISRRPYTLPEYQNAENAGTIEPMHYLRSGAYFRTKPVMISTGSVLNHIDVEMNVPEETAVNLYVRSGDNYFSWTDDYPEWKDFTSGEDLQGVSGLYFQVAARLYPDGDGCTTPSITSIKLDYTELPLPLPPFSVRAVAGDGCVTLKWNHSVDETAGGYYVYYGNRSGEYLGRIAVEGASPVNVGNTTSFTLTGLQNGTIYYFAVATWSIHNENVIGSLSKEVFARPIKGR